MLKSIPLLSVIIPVFNSENSLETCLKNLLNSNFDSNYEIIIINDGSTDATSLKCQMFSNYFNHIHIFEQENYGVSYSRNKGLQFAKGDWVMFLDSDDYYSPDWYDIVSDGIKKNPNADLIVFGKDVENRIYTSEECVKNAITINSKNKLNNNFHISMSKIYSRKFIIENNIIFYDKLINGEDLIFNCESFILAKVIEGVNSSFYNYSKNMASSTNHFNLKIMENETIYLNKIKKIVAMLDFTTEEKLLIYSFIEASSINTLLYKASFSNDDKDIKLIKKHILANYKQLLLTYSLKQKSNFSFFQRFCLFFVSKEKINFAIYLYIIRNSIKTIFYKTKGNSVIEII